MCRILTFILYAKNPLNLIRTFDSHIFRKDDEKKKDKYKAGVMLGLSGREMFAFNPTMVGDEVKTRIEYLV